MIERFFYLKEYLLLNSQIFPKELKDVEKVKDLKGSTSPELVKYNDFLFVKKFCKIDHTKNECFTQKLYKVSGCPYVPVMKYYENNDSSFLMSEYITGELLRTIIITNNNTVPEEIKSELKKYFVLDCLFLNWDVIGGKFDNIIVKDGKCYRVDLGGALEFRAQGEKKENKWLVKEVSELDSMKNNVNFTSYHIFSSITQEEICEQIEKILKRKKEIQELIDNEYEGDKKLIVDRIDYLEDFLNKTKKSL